MYKYLFNNMYNLQCISSVTAVLASIMYVGAIDKNSLSIACLQCLCHAMSKCNGAFGCDGRTCGPYKISQPFWKEAGKFTIESDNADSPGAYSRCANDPVCATRTVYNYMKLFRKDCDNNGDVDCLDIIRAHLLGLENCSQYLYDSFKNGLCSCLHRREDPKYMPVGCKHK
ncbi:invertebrate-type lysozyme 3-like [Lycorma delicatula]|uniref:invertebrate-type lysozyme 3-like n=1 Tax=Lycorma delicatula TaxID=130591 RepID=UPI003F514B80